MRTFQAYNRKILMIKSPAKKNDWCHQLQELTRFWRLNAPYKKKAARHKQPGKEKERVKHGPKGFRSHTNGAEPPKNPL